VDEVMYRVSYQGYLQRELRQIAKMQEVERVRIPTDFDYDVIKGLRAECRQKLIQFKPDTLGRASRISGVNPADINILLSYLARRNPLVGP